MTKLTQKEINELRDELRDDVTSADETTYKIICKNMRALDREQWKLDNSDYFAGYLDRVTDRWWDE